jgi:VWFA-related protein
MWRSSMSVAFAAVSGSLLAASVVQQPTPPASTQQPVFRAASNLVEVDAVVTDKKGDVVRGLKQDDFQLTEDGKPQSIVQFAFVDLPVPSVEAQSTPRVRSDVVTNATTPDGRLYVIVLDGFHVDATRSTVVRKLAKQFVDNNLGAKDVAAVVEFGALAYNQPFTSDRALLSAAIEKFVGRKAQSASVNIANDALLKPQEIHTPEDSESDARANDARVMFESLKQVCQQLGASQGHRRSVVLFSEGVDFDTSDFIGGDQRPGQRGAELMHQTSKHASDVVQAQQDMLIAARRANVALYTIDPRGNTMGDENLMQTVGSVTLGTLAEAQRGQGTMRTFASETGGVSVVGTNDITTGFKHIVQANSSYYVLGYVPAATTDGLYHRIAVTVKSRDLDVAARKGYFAVPEEAAAKAATPPAANPNAPSVKGMSPQMRTILGSQFPVSGLGLRATGGALRVQHDGMLVTLVVEIDTTNLPFSEQNGQLSNDIELGYVAIDSAGKVHAGNRSVGSLRMPASERSSTTNGLRYVTEFVVPPGRYQVRVGVHESAGDSGGSAILDVDAPTAAKNSLSMGAVLLTTPSAQAVPTTGTYPIVKALVSNPPTARRDFSNQDNLSALVYLLEPNGEPQAVDVTTVVRNAQGEEVFRSAALKRADEFDKGTSSCPVVSVVPLTSLKPGAYELTLEGHEASGATSSRALSFTIR